MIRLKWSVRSLLATSRLLAKSATAVALIIVILTLAVFVQFFPMNPLLGNLFKGLPIVSAQTAPSSSCIQSTSSYNIYNVTSPMLFENLQCTFIGLLNVTATGSLTLINSTLNIGGTNIAGVLSLGGYAQLVLVNSILNLNYTNMNYTETITIGTSNQTETIPGVSTGDLDITNNSTMTLTNSAVVVGGNLSSTNFGTLDANESSAITASNVAATDLSIFNVNSSSIKFLTPLANVTFVGSKFSLYGSNLQFANATNLILDSNETDITNSQVEISTLSSSPGNVTIGKSATPDALMNVQNSQIEISNAANVILGRSLAPDSFTTFANSQVVVNDASNVTLGRALSPNSTLEITNSQIQINSAVENFTGIGSFYAGSDTSITSTSIQDVSQYTDNFSIWGTNFVNILNSKVNNTVLATGRYTSLLSVLGGSVSVSGSTVSSSCIGYYGYSPATFSNLTVSSNLSQSIVNSKLLAGNNGAYGIYSESQLLLYSLQNMSVISSLVQSVSNEAFIKVIANNPGNVDHNINLDHMTLETSDSPGNVTLASNYGLQMNDSDIDANSSIVSLEVYLLTSYDSSISSQLILGGTQIGTAYLYNTTSLGINETSPGKLRTEAYYQYGWFQIHTITNTSTPIANASISILDSSTGQLEYSTTSNSSGWAEIPALIYSNNASGILNQSSYIVQATAGSTSSSQLIVPTADSFNTTVVLGAPVDLFNYPIGNITSSLGNLNYEAFPVQVFFGQTGQTNNYLGILSNAAPLNFYNNVTHSQLDFSTSGSTGSTYYFTAIYPKNLSTIPITVEVNGVATTVQVRSNSTFYFATFSVPSGPNSIALSFVSPNGQYIYTVFPYFYPTMIVMVVVVILAAVGGTFLILYARQKDRNMKPPPVASS